MHLFRRRTFIISIVLAFMVLATYGVWQTSRFHIVSTKPSLSGVPDIIPYIEINFNQKLADQGYSVSSSSSIIDGYSIDNKTLRINLKSTTADKKYSLQLSNIKSVKGEVISKTLELKTKTIPFDKLPGGLQQTIVNGQNPKDPSLPANDPLVAYLPYGDLGYNISYTITTQDNKPALSVKISVILSGSDYKLSQPELENKINQRQQQARDYIRSLNLDPAKYNIRYSVPAH